MNKPICRTILLLVLAQLTIHADIHNYTTQGSIELVPNIINVGYSPDQKHLIVLADAAENNTFVHYHGLRLNQRQTIPIVDNDTDLFNVKPSAFAFSLNGELLLIGTSYGAVYGYPITNGTLQPTFKYKKYIGNKSVQDGIKSISFSSNGLIAVAAKDLLVVLEVPTDEQATQFIQKNNFKFQGILSSVAWKLNSLNIVIFGGNDATPYFHIFDINTNISTPIGTPQKTLSIGVFPDGDQTILQGRFDKDIQVYQWNQNLSNYQSTSTIPGTTKASEISITADGLFFAAQINSDNKVLAWKSGLQLNSRSNLKNQAPQSIDRTAYLNETGRNLALSSDGNRILIIDQTSTAKKFSICDSAFYYDQKNNICQDCQNDCGQCFDATNCNTCKNETRYVDKANVCQPCSGIIDGCQQCTDSTTCKNCNTVEHWDPTPVPQNNTCRCDTTYYLNKTTDKTTCQSCSILKYCEECQTSTKCTKCSIADNTDLINGSCVCKDGWYFDANTVCQDCTQQTGCKKCSSATNCTLCDSVFNWIEDPKGSGKCICEPGYWQNGTTCQPCNTKTLNCTACQQDGTCTTCIDTRVVNPQKTKCICQDHTYEDQTTSQCKQCDKDKQCLHCLATQNNTCTECDSLIAHRLPMPVNGQCKCQRGYTENDIKFCTICSIRGCANCETVNVCTQCFEEKNFIAQPAEDQSCKCKPDYLPKEDGQSCSTCALEMSGCTKCENLNICQACSEQDNFIPQPNTANKCSCKESYVLKNSQCKLCTDEYSKCETCNDTQCLTCKANYHPTDDNKKCLSCGQAITGCTQCTDIYSCTQCNAQKYWQLDSDNKNCICKKSFFKNSTECKYCGMEYPYCSNCTLQEGCFNCLQTFIYNKQLKTCYCPEEKEVKDGKCEDKSGLSALAIIAIIVGILAVAGAAVAIIKCFKKRRSPLEDGEYEALEAEKNQ